MWQAGPKIALQFLDLFVCLWICASPLITCTINVMYIVAVLLYFSRLDSCFEY